MNLENNNNIFQNKKIICLIGMMGVGKTTIGKKLAEKLDYYYFDSDNEISDYTKKSIADIFFEDGEGYFRKIEKDIIKKLINREERMVISLGGGSVISKKTRELLHKKSIIIWLDADIDTIISRTKNSIHRPKLEQSSNKRKFLIDLKKKRKELYAEASFKIVTNDDNYTKIIDNILQQIER